jgi:hypothetical protein
LLYSLFNHLQRVANIRLYIKKAGTSYEAPEYEPV